MSALPFSRRTCLGLMAASLSQPLAWAATPRGRTQGLVHAGFDELDGFFQAYDTDFQQNWRTPGGEPVPVERRGGHSRAQTLALIKGLKADVVSAAAAGDLDALARQGLLQADWQRRLRGVAGPFTSTVVFVVRKDNPRRLNSWIDLVRPGVKVVAAHPRTSDTGRWTWLAAYGFALRDVGGDGDMARRFARSLYARVPALEASARTAMATFVQRRQGDVLLLWESDALRLMQGPAAEDLQLVYPGTSVLIEPCVNVVDRVVDQRGTLMVAQAYVTRLYAPEAQEMAARHGLRPTEPKVAARHAGRFAAVDRFTVDKVFGGWKVVESEHLAPGGVFDQVSVRR